MTDPRRTRRADAPPLGRGGFRVIVAAMRTRAAPAAVHLLASVALLAAAVGASATLAATGVSRSAAGAAEEPAAAVNYLLFAADSSPQSREAVGAATGAARRPDLDELLRDSNHNHASDRVNLSLANSVWRQMRDHALDFARKRADETRPSLNRLLAEANISAACNQSLNQIVDHLARLDSWAVQMYNAFGDFPATGLFEGSITSMGSYRQCVDLEPNQWIGEPRYCTFKFQPIVPKRPRFHNILAPIDGLANFTSKDDMFRQLAAKAHYFYYAKARVATCMPSKCSQADLDSLGARAAVNTYLQFAGVGCLEKQVGYNPDGAQIFALTILFSLASISFLGTFVHILNLRSWFEDRQPSKATSAVPTTTTTTTTKGNERKNNLIVVNDLNSASVLGDKHHTLTQTLLDPSMQSAKSSPIILSTPIIMPPTTQASEDSSNPLSSQQGDLSPLRVKILRLIDCLVHFSMVKNGKKLFDTRTSTRNRRSSSSSSSSSSSAPALDAKVVQVQAETESTCTSASSRSSEAGSEEGRCSDISCVHGLRFWTITWIIFGHTMQYTEWAGFARAFQVESNLIAFLIQPLLNATFSVDTFFLISGLLTTYVTWSITRGSYRRFNKFAFLVSRYLRLTPQVMLVVLLFIVYPMTGDGPYWKGLVQKESDNCKRNWWVSALYLQAFFHQDQICNLVTWWLSIEMFYHLVSILVIIALLHSARKGICVALLFGGGMTAISTYLHYANSYPPNMLPTLLQRYEVWDSIVLKFFWTPYPHAPAYFVGLMLGYILYNRSLNQLSKQQVKLGWTVFAIAYSCVLFGTYGWNKNDPYTRLTSTIYYNVSQVTWALATGWAIHACATGNGGWLNSFLSSPIFIPLGRATYMTYLSHMLIVMAYPAKMHLLIEPSYLVFSYIFIANLFLSYGLGIILTLVYESPILHLQKLLVRNMATKYNDTDHKSATSRQSSTNSNGRQQRRQNHMPTMMTSSNTTTPNDAG